MKKIKTPMKLPPKKRMKKKNLKRLTQMKKVMKMRSLNDI